MSNPPFRWNLTSIAFLVVLAAITGCSPKKPESQKGGSGPQASQSPDDDLGSETRGPGAGRKIVPADWETLAAFGEAYARAMTDGDGDVSRASWNPEALMEIVVGDTERQAPEFVERIKRDFISLFEKAPGGVMRMDLGQPWRMLRVGEVDGETRILFRIAAADGGLIYKDLILRLNAEDHPEFVDAYAFAKGEKRSESLRRVFLRQVAEAANIPIETLLSETDPLVTYRDQSLAVAEAFRAKNYAEAIENFRNASEEIQKEKTILLMYLAAAAKLMAAGEDPEAEAHLDGATRFQKLFGDDPAFLLMRLDYHFFKEDYEAASETIDELDKAVSGDDTYLDFLRAHVLMAREQYEDALPLLRKLLQSDPDFEDPYWGVVNIQLALGNFKAVAEGLDQLIERFDYEFELDEDPAYETFLSSTEGKAWIEKHKKATGDN